MCGPQLHGKRLLMGRPRAGHARPLQCFPIVPYIPRKSKAPRRISGEQNYYTRFRFVRQTLSSSIRSSVPMSVNLAKCKNLQHFSPRILSYPSLG